MLRISVSFQKTSCGKRYWLIALWLLFVFTLVNALAAVYGYQPYLDIVTEVLGVGLISYWIGCIAKKFSTKIYPPCCDPRPPVICLPDNLKAANDEHYKVNENAR